MYLCIDVGNTQIFIGVYDNSNLLLTFRYPTLSSMTSDQIGLFLREILRENKINPDNIKRICISSVVPELDYTINSACIKYFTQEPVFLTTNKIDDSELFMAPSVRKELGSDRLANIIAALDSFPNENLLVIDFGTATTICVVSKDKKYLGGAILPGVKTSAKALALNTAKLPMIEITQPASFDSNNTRGHILNGIYYGQLGAIKEIIERAQQQHFGGEQATVIATGGFANLYREEGVFDYLVPDLILQGLNIFIRRG